MCENIVPCSKCRNLVRKIRKPHARNAQKSCSNMHQHRPQNAQNVMLKMHKRHAQNAQKSCTKCNVVLKMRKRAQNAETLCSKCGNVMRKMRNLYVQETFTRQVPQNAKRHVQHAEASCSKCKTLCKRVRIHADVLRKELGGRALLIHIMRMRIYLVVARPSSVMAERRQPSCNTPYV